MIRLIESEHFNQRTRHLALRYHHCGSQVRDGVLKIAHLPTDLICSDALTKPVDRKAHEQHTRVLLGHTRVVWLARDEHVSAMRDCGSQ